VEVVVEGAPGEEPTHELSVGAKRNLEYLATLPRAPSGKAERVVRLWFCSAPAALVADDSVAIVRQLLVWCDGDAADLVLTTGGTGLSPRDNTPEATRAVLDREAEGIAERLRVACIDSFPRAALSRGVAGSRNRTLVVNLPGSTSGVRDALHALVPIVDHAVAITRAQRTDH
jgi:molybdenum cofactor synthesis domain-containing protein